MTEEIRKITSGPWHVAKFRDDMEEFDEPDFEVRTTPPEGAPLDYYTVFTAYGHPGDGDAEKNAHAASMLPQMIDLIRAASRMPIGGEHAGWLVDEAKDLIAALDSI